jgi:hypothetical protein
MAAKPVPDPRASSVPSAGAWPDPGEPTSRPRPASASATVAISVAEGLRRVSTASAVTTSTGVAPSVTSVARLTEVSATAAK